MAYSEEWSNEEQFRVSTHRVGIFELCRDQYFQSPRAGGRRSDFATDAMQVRMMEHPEEDCIYRVEEVKP